MRKCLNVLLKGQTTHEVTLTLTDLKFGQVIPLVSNFSNFLTKLYTKFWVQTSSYGSLAKFSSFMLSI